MEIYKSYSETAYLRIYVNGVLTNASGSVTAKIYDIYGEVLVNSPTITAVSTGIYSLVIPATATVEEGDFSVVWSFNGIQKTNIYSVVTPYIEAYDLLSVVPDGTSWEGAKIAEQYARDKIEAFTGQTFGNQIKIVNCKGKGTDFLPVPQRIISFESVVENGVEVIDITDEINDFGNDVKISSTKYALEVDRDSDVTEYRQTGMRTRGGAFKESWDYDVYGKWGWEFVPNDIQLVAKELVRDYFCQDNKFKESYVLSVKTNGFGTQFDPGIFYGTGNSYCDLILNDYVRFNWSIV